MELKNQKIREFLEDTKIEFIYKGKEELSVKGFSSFQKLKDNSLTWLKVVSQESLKAISGKTNMLVVCKEESICRQYPDINYIFCNHPKAVFFNILSEFFQKDTKPEIATTAVVESNNIGKNCSIGHHSYIGPDVILKDNVCIGNTVVIRNSVYIGKNTIIGSGCVIGEDGFGFYKDLEGVSIRVPHFGGVEIGENVEIGSNTCIDRGTLDNTVIGDYVKIDNLCHIAHNVQIGKKSKIIALSLLAGSSQIGESVYVAPGTLVKNQIKVGKNSVIGMGSMVLKDVEEGKVLVGAPAKILRDITEEDFNL